MLPASGPFTKAHLGNTTPKPGTASGQSFSELLACSVRAPRAAKAAPGCAARVDRAGPKPALAAKGRPQRLPATQIDAARRQENRLAQAHAQSAQTSRALQCERLDDRVRVSLFQQIARECHQPAITSGREPTRDTDAPVVVEPVAPAREPEPQSPEASGAGERAQAIAAMVERVELALRCGLPSMSLALSGRAWSAAVEITRTGKGTVAVRLTARAGRRKAFGRAGEELRAALEARGLRVSSVTIA